MSTMDNLHRKGWQDSDRDGKAYRYTAVEPRGIQRPAHARGDRRGRPHRWVLSHFVAAMDGGQAEALRAVIDRLAGKRPS